MEGFTVRYSTIQSLITILKLLPSIPLIYSPAPLPFQLADDVALLVGDFQFASAIYRDS
jgi:hypothetical protein